MMFRVNVRVVLPELFMHAFHAFLRSKLLNKRNQKAGDVGLQLLKKMDELDCKVNDFLTVAGMWSWTICSVGVSITPINSSIASTVSGSIGVGYDDGSQENQSTNSYVPHLEFL